MDIFYSKYHNYTFYVDNLSGFDSIFLLDPLTKDNFASIKTHKKEDGTLVFINIIKEIKVEVKNPANKEKENSANPTIKYETQKRTIKILDSRLMLNEKLPDLCMSFDTQTKIRFFPNSFLTDNTLRYKGTTPLISFFKGIKESEYKKIFTELNYSIPEEAKKYLESNLLGLKEVILKFAEIIFKEFGLNITKYKTISGLSLNTYLSNFYNLSKKVTIIKGDLEQEIRKSYFGGLVYLHKPGLKIKKGHHYDMNAQYPAMMLKPMPTGNPTFSTDNNLNNYFGFCYADIVPPKNLINQLIPFKGEDGKVTCPSTPFSGLYFSELLKSALSYGYSIKIKGGFKFEKTVGVFDDFVETIHKKRIEAKNNGNKALSLTLKQVLNTFTGRLGMRNTENKTEIVDLKRAD